MVTYEDGPTLPMTIACLSVFGALAALSAAITVTYNTPPVRGLRRLAAAATFECVGCTEHDITPAFGHDERSTR